MKLDQFTMLSSAAAFALLLLFTGKSMEEPGDKKAELAEIARVVDSCIGWVKEKDQALLFSCVAHDPNYVSVHPSKRVVRGFKQFKANISFFMSPDFRYVRHEISDLAINLSKSGDVAWFYCVLDDMNEWKGKPANWEDTRWTGVLEKREGKWVIVQQHFSFPFDS